MFQMQFTVKVYHGVFKYVYDFKFPNSLFFPVTLDVKSHLVNTIEAFVHLIFCKIVFANTYYHF